MAQKIVLPMMMMTIMFMALSLIKFSEEYKTHKVRATTVGRCYYAFSLFGTHVFVAAG
jgi:hypothetical protein